MIESRIKKTQDRFMHVTILFIAIGMLIWAMIYFIIPLARLSDVRSGLLITSVVVSFLISVIFGVARLAPHKLEKYLEDLENFRSNGSLSEIEKEQFIGMFLEEAAKLEE